MTVELIMMFSTAIVTFVLGFIPKKLELYESKKIPIQNALIGILAGLIAYGCGMYDNILVGILTCFAGSMMAGGAYDLSKTRGGKNETIE